MPGNAMRRGLALIAAFLAGALSAQAASAQQQATWSTVAPIPIARNETAAAAVNEKIYLVGGAWTETKDGKQVDHYTDGFTTEYDPKTNRWRERAREPEGLTHQGIAVWNGKIYVAGGFALGRHMMPSAGVYSYDPATDQWQVLAPLSSPRGALVLATVDGMIHAIGGRLVDDSPTLGVHEVYNPAINSWRFAAPLPTPRDHSGVFVVDGKIHVIGGRTADAKSNVGLHDVYDPATDKWTRAAPMPTPRSNAAFAEYHGMLLMAGGECRTDNTAYNEVEAYDPKTARWLTLPSLPTSRHAFGAAVADGRLFFIGGTVPCASPSKVAEVLELRLR